MKIMMLSGLTWIPQIEVEKSYKCNYKHPKMVQTTNKKLTGTQVL